METPCSSFDCPDDPAHELPFVFLNLAISADGKIATANRRVTSFTSSEDHDHLLELRSYADAVMAGARTVDTEAVNMGPGPKPYRDKRIARGLKPYNLRVVVSGSGTLNPGATLFEKRFSPIVVVTTENAGQERLDRLRGVADHVQVSGAAEIDFKATLQWLYRDWGVRSLLCEGGSYLNAALFQARLVHRLHLTISPKIIGGTDAPTLIDGPLADRLDDAVEFELQSRKEGREELFTVYRVVGLSGGVV